MRRPSIRATLVGVVFFAAVDAAPWGACSSPSYVDSSGLSVPLYAPQPSAGQIPAPPRPLFVLANATISFRLPTQPTIDAATLQAPPTACPHLAANLVNWHDPSTWPDGTVPSSGDVVLPNGTSVLLSSCSLAPGDALGAVTIPLGSSLVFADSAAGVNLTASSISVQGSLAAGSPSCRLRGFVTITLTGVRPGVASGNVSQAQLAILNAPAEAKGLVVDGTLDLHGAQYTPTWTRLATTARAGDSLVWLQEPVNWEPGQMIVVVTSALRDSRDYSESEERRIVQAWTTPDGISALQLDRPLQYSHTARAEYQTEVALLSRRVIFQGAANDSAPIDVPSNPANLSCLLPSTSSSVTYGPCANQYLTGYGGHVMVRGPAAVGRISGVLLSRVGQTNVLGHYPIHFHFVGSGGPKSFVQDSSFWHSYYRCVSIHATNGTRLSRNVAHDITGYCYYLEDGVENGNTLEYNLASWVHTLYQGSYFPTTGTSAGQFMDDQSTSSYLVLPADTTAAGFYITNVNNNLTGNVAAGGWSGFVFPILPALIGLSRYTPAPPPQSLPTSVFDGNVAHSSGFWWSLAGCIYVGGLLQYPSTTATSLMYNPGRFTSGHPGKVTFTRTKVWGCSIGVMHWGSQALLDRIEAADFTTRSFSVFGAVHVSNALVTCRSGAVLGTGAVSRTGAPTGPFYQWGLAQFQWYDTGQSHIVTNMTVLNCSSSNPLYVGFQSLTHSWQFVPSNMQVTANISMPGVPFSFANSVTVNNSYPSVSHRLTNWLDADGSVTGRGRPTLIASARTGGPLSTWWQLDTPSAPSPCARAWDMWLCDARPVVSLSMTWNASLQATVGTSSCPNSSPLTASAPCPDVGTVGHVGFPSASAMAFTYNPVLTGPANGFGWIIRFTAGAPSNISFSNVQMAPNDTLIIVLPYPPGTTVSVAAVVTSGYCNPRNMLCSWNFTRVASADLVRARPTADAYYLSDSGHLYFRVTAQNGWAGLGVNRAFGVQPNVGFSAAGLSIPYRSSAAQVSVTAVCPPWTTDVVTGFWCTLPTPLVDPPSPCADVGLSQVSFDACATATQTASASPRPSLSPVASALASQMPSASRAASTLPGPTDLLSPVPSSALSPSQSAASTTATSPAPLTAPSQTTPPTASPSSTRYAGSCLLPASRVTFSVNLWGNVSLEALARPNVALLLRLGVACSVGVPLYRVALLNASSAGVSPSCVVVFGESHVANLASGTCSTSDGLSLTASFSQSHVAAPTIPAPSNACAPSVLLITLSVLSCTGDDAVRGSLSVEESASQLSAVISAKGANTTALPGSSSYLGGLVSGAFFDAAAIASGANLSNIWITPAGAPLVSGVVSSVTSVVVTGTSSGTSSGAPRAFSTGAIAAVTVAAIVVLAATGFAIVIVRRRRAARDALRVLCQHDAREVASASKHSRIADVATFDMRNPLTAAQTHAQAERPTSATLSASRSQRRVADVLPGLVGSGDSPSLGGGDMEPVPRVTPGGLPLPMQAAPCNTDSSSPHSSPAQL